MTVSLTGGQHAFLETFFVQPFSTPFYLTGGTALAVYHLHHRISMDLDLFTPDGEAAQDAARWTIALRDEGRLRITSHFAQASFHNFRLVFEGERLRVDYCVDGAPQLPKETHGRVRTDNLLDILANKVVAVLDFPEPKHLIDLYFGLRRGAHGFAEVLEHARRKRTIDPYHLARALHLGKHFSSPALQLLDPPDPADVARVFEELRNQALGALSPPGTR